MQTFSSIFSKGCLQLALIFSMLVFLISFQSLGNFIFFWINLRLSMTFSSAKFFKHLKRSLLILARASLCCCMRSFCPIVRSPSLVFLKNFCVLTIALEDYRTFSSVGSSSSIFYSSMIFCTGSGISCFFSSSSDPSFISPILLSCLCDISSAF